MLMICVDISLVLRLGDKPAFKEGENVSVVEGTDDAGPGRRRTREACTEGKLTLPFEGLDPLMTAGDAGLAEV
jgi:hypothetical protein